MDEHEQELMTRLNYAVFGVRGDNGILGRMDSLQRNFEAYVAKEDARRQDDLQRERNRDRSLTIAALSAVGALLGVIVTLIVVLVGG